METTAQAGDTGGGDDAANIAALSANLEGAQGGTGEQTGDIGGNADVSETLGAGESNVQESADEGGQASGAGELQFSPEDLSRVLANYTLLKATGAVPQQASEAVPATPATQAQQAKPAPLPEKDDFDDVLSQFDSDDVTRKALERLRAADQAKQARIEQLEAFYKEAKAEKERAAQEAKVAKINAEWQGIADTLRTEGYEHILGKKGQSLDASHKYHLLTYVNTCEAIRIAHPGATPEAIRKAALGIFPAKPKQSTVPPSVRRTGNATRSVPANQSAPRSDEENIALLGKLLQGTR
jgi:hypothetical protein